MQQPASLERVEQWAGDGATVRPYEQLSVPGLEIFIVTTKPPEGVAVSDYTPPRRGVAVQGSAIFEGQAAMEAVTDAGVSEPLEIAKLSLLFLHDGGDLVTEGEGVAAPGYQGRALVYFWRASDMGRQLMKSQLNTASFEVTSEPVGAGASPVADARATLASDSQIAWRGAIGQLRAVCAADGEARALLLETARGHRDAATRAQAAEAAGACQSPEVIAPLGEVLRGDKDEQARAGAATGLGATGSERAAEVLKAAQGDEKSDSVRRAIAFALGQIERGAP